MNIKIIGKSIYTHIRALRARTHTHTHLAVKRMVGLGKISEYQLQGYSLG